MKLSDFVAPSRVLIPLDCEPLDSARTALLERLVASGAIDDLERLQSRVAEERGEDMVAIADHAFLLHYRTDTATSLQVAIGICRDGIRRVLGEETAQHAPVVAVVVGPPRLAARQLQVVRAFAQALADWFPEHARVMDLGLARWLVQRQLGGSPIVLRRLSSRTG